jgi:hypothetical protein
MDSKKSRPHGALVFCLCLFWSSLGEAIRPPQSPSSACETPLAAADQETTPSIEYVGGKHGGYVFEGNRPAALISSTGKISSLSDHFEASHWAIMERQLGKKFLANLQYSEDPMEELKKAILSRTRASQRERYTQMLDVVSVQIHALPTTEIPEALFLDAVQALEKHHLSFRTSAAAVRHYVSKLSPSRVHIDQTTSRYTEASFTVKTEEGRIEPRSLRIYIGKSGYDAAQGMLNFVFENRWTRELDGLIGFRKKDRGPWIEYFDSPEPNPRNDSSRLFDRCEKKGEMRSLKIRLG